MWWLGSIAVLAGMVSVGMHAGERPAVDSEARRGVLRGGMLLVLGLAFFYLGTAEGQAQSAAQPGMMLVTLLATAVTAMTMMLYFDTSSGSRVWTGAGVEERSTKERLRDHRRSLRAEGRTSRSRASRGRNLGGGRPSRDRGGSRRVL